jgi:hypothetical protein
MLSASQVPPPGLPPVTLSMGKLYSINGRNLIFINLDLEAQKRKMKNYIFIDINLTTPRQPLLVPVSLNDFKDESQADPRIATKTILTSQLFGYIESPTLSEVETNEYYTLSTNGDPTKASKSRFSTNTIPDSAGPFYWRKTSFRDRSMFTIPTSATNIKAGAYDSRKTQDLYEYYIKKYNKSKYRGGTNNTKKNRYIKNKSKKNRN